PKHAARIQGVCCSIYDARRETTPKLIDEMKVDISRSVDWCTERNLPDARAVMSVDSANDVSHRRKYQNITDSTRGLHVGQNEWLCLHASCISDDWYDRRS